MNEGEKYNRLTAIYKRYGLEIAIEKSRRKEC